MKRTAAAAVLLALATTVMGQVRTVSIGSGSATGVYQVAAEAICRLVNRGTGQHGIRCAVQGTGGSVHNVEALKRGELDFAIVQSDVQYHAVKGQGSFKESGAYGDLRAVFSVYPEPLMVLARNRAKVNAFEDFKGKRFNVGNPGSGTRATIDVLMTALNMKTGDFSQATELSADEHARALCENRIDGFGFVVGNPAPNIHYATKSCGARLIPLTGPAIDRLVIDYPYFAYTTIGESVYPGNTEPVRTFGVVATFVTSAKVPEDIVHIVAGAVFDHFDEFRRQHPSFTYFHPMDTINSGLTAPLHNGAFRYFREKGWIRRGD